MKEFSRCVILFCVTLCMTTQLCGQSLPQGNAAGHTLEETARVVQYMNRAMRFQQAFPQEKVYVHFDNTGYFKGERIWMKAYVTRTDNGLPTDLSRVLYVDLLNQSGDIVAKRKLKIEHGEAAGDIDTDSIIGTGFFEVRAYTRYMLNFGEETAFSRVFPLFRKPASEGDYSSPTLDKSNARYRFPEREEAPDSTVLDATAATRRKMHGHHVNFYPEGGNMVVGLPSRVAFTVTDRSHRPAETMGLLQDAAGHTVAVVKTGADGRGLFDIVPTDTTLTLILSDAQNTKCEFPVGGILREGCTLRVDATTERGTVTARLMSSSSVQGRLLGYTVMQNGNIVFADTLTAEPTMEISMERASLRVGVHQLTFFDSGGRILAERLFFICPPAGGNVVQIDTPTDRLTCCGKVELNLKTTPHARLSLSAMDATTLPNGTYGDIRTYMLLGSDVRGYIPNPERYFEADDAAHRAAADSLMLFNGWRRYEWQRMTALHPWPERIEPVEDSLYVFGSLKRAMSHWKKKNPVEGVELTAYLYNRDGEQYNGKTVSDSSGYYAFRLPDMEGEYELQIETRRNGGLKTYTIGIDRQFAPEARYLDRIETQMIPPTGGNLTFPFDLAQATDSTSQLGDRDEPLRRHTGKYSFVTKTVQIKQPKHYWTDFHGGWYNEHDGHYHADLNYDCLAATDAFIDRAEIVPTLLSWLCVQNNLLRPDGVEIKVPPTYQNFADCISSSTFGLRYDNRPIIWILDNGFKSITGLSENEYGKLLIRPLRTNNHTFPTYLDEVRSVYIAVDDPQAANHFVQGLDHLRAVVIFVYTIPSYTTASNKGRRRTHFMGFNKPERFKGETYADLLPQPSDVRRTLLWEPYIEADGDGKAHVEFYNNYTCKDILISAEGIAPDGTPICNE